MSDPKTVRVRIAVAVDENGKWLAQGSAGAHDATVTSDIVSPLRGLGGSPHLVWVVAYVPLPDIPVVQGSVSPAEIVP